MPTYSIQSHPLENLIEVDVDLLLNLFAQQLDHRAGCGWGHEGSAR